MAQIPDARDEEELVDSVKEAAALVRDGGLCPDDAVVKVARERGLTPGKVRAVSYGYNTGRQTHQRQSQSAALDKLASFALADPDAIIARLYGPQAKSADVDPDYAAPPAWRHERGRAEARAKAAAYVLPTLPPPQAAPDSLAALRRAYADIDRVKRGAAEARLAAAAAEDELRVKVAGVVEYFRAAPEGRLPFAAVAKAAATYLDARAGPLLDLVYLQAHLGDSHPYGRPAEKRGGDAAAWYGAVEPGRQPLAGLRDCLRLADVVLATRKQAALSAARAQEVEAEALRPFARPAKAAGILGTPAVGAAFGTMLTRSIGNVPQTRDDLVEDAWLGLEDPEHQNEIRKIRAHAMLNGMLTDPEDPISGYDPEQVLSAYNEIAQMAPRVAEQPAALRPLLRRRLAGHPESFEAKEMTDIEKGLAQSKLPTPNTSLLGEAPGKLLS